MMMMMMGHFIIIIINIIMNIYRAPTLQKHKAFYNEHASMIKTKQNKQTKTASVAQWCVLQTADMKDVNSFPPESV